MQFLLAKILPNRNVNYIYLFIKSFLVVQCFHSSNCGPSEFLRRYSAVANASAAATTPNSLEDASSFNNSTANAALMLRQQSSQRFSDSQDALVGTSSNKNFDGQMPIPSVSLSKFM